MAPLWHLHADRGAFRRRRRPEELQRANARATRELDHALADGRRPMRLRAESLCEKPQAHLAVKARVAGEGEVLVQTSRDELLRRGLEEAAMVNTLRVRTDGIH